MKREEIIRMAREAGFSVHDGIITGGVTDLERFAALVAAAEREACAKVVDAWSAWHGGTETIAAAIRAREQE